MEIKGEEVRMIIDRMEQYKRQKDKEVAAMKKRLQGAEEDCKVLIGE